LVILPSGSSRLKLYARGSTVWEYVHVGGRRFAEELPTEGLFVDLKKIGTALMQELIERTYKQKRIRMVKIYLCFAFDGIVWRTSFPIFTGK